MVKPEGIMGTYIFTVSWSDVWVAPEICGWHLEWGQLVEN